MKISYNWLKQYIHIDIPPVELARILTDTGLEVEGIETVESVKGSMKGMVVGQVLTCEKHPNADKLSVTTVDVGTRDPLPIVCGAPNVAAGQKVVVATVGTTLYPAGAEEGFKIKKATIRGEVSEGMICAEDELGVGTDHTGIVILDEHALVGDDAINYFNVETDTVFEIGLTPNRIDGGSHIGVARDIYAYLKQHATPLPLAIPSVDQFSIDNHALTIPVEVKDPEACPRYSGVTLTTLEVKESPDWLKRRLLAIGQVPINNVVDITNYVLHECGQPLHAFDASEIKGNKVIVQTLPEGTPFVTLDEKERKLTAKDLMICNESEPMCIGGVFGGIRSGVTEKTTAIFLESATFNPVSIRRTSRHHLLNTDASFRFERGSDPNGTLWALQRAALLMKELAGATISSEIIDVYPKPVGDFRVEVSLQRISRLIGKTIPPEEIISILESLDITVAERNDDKLVLNAPPYRVDVKREADVVEEILRIYGYNNIEFSDQVRSTLAYVEKPDKEKAVNVISDMLSGLGFLEIKSNSLTREAYFDEKDPAVVSIHNPLSQDLSRMRKDLLMGGLEAVIYNINRKNTDLRLYEFGNCYFIDPDRTADHPQKKYDEEEHLGLFITGDFTTSNWVTGKDEASYYHIRSLVDLVLTKLGTGSNKLQFKETANAAFSEAMDIYAEDTLVGTFGKVASGKLNILDIKQDVYAAELRWNVLLQLLAQRSVTYEELSRYPEVKRDLSLMIDRKVRFEELVKVSFTAETRLLKEVDLFDVYEGDTIEKGKKSYALTYTLLDREKTLTDKQIDRAMNHIAQALEKQLGAVIRGAV
jgi:phenylalanyl-tRNA synthetase beta chain